MCPFTVRVSHRLSLAGFLGSMLTGAVPLARRPRGTLALRLGGCASLPASAPLRFNLLFRQEAAVSLLRRRVALYDSNGILTVSAIGIAFRLILRTRLTLNRLTLFRKPWSFGEGASHPLYRYLYLHLLFHALQSGSSRAFDASWNAPLPMLLRIPRLR